MTIQEQSKHIPGKRHRLGCQDLGLRFVEPMVRGYRQAFPMVSTGAVLGGDWNAKGVAT